MFALGEIWVRNGLRSTLFPTAGTVTHGRCQTKWRCEMTRSRMYALTAVSAGLYVCLCWAFADGMFSLSGSALWNSDAYLGSTIWTYVMLAAIVVAGSTRRPGFRLRGCKSRYPVTSPPARWMIPAFWKLIMGSTFYAFIWLPLRFFVGREWAGRRRAQGSRRCLDEGRHGAQGLLGSVQWRFLTGRPSSPPITYAWFRTSCTTCSTTSGTPGSPR